MSNKQQLIVERIWLQGEEALIPVLPIGQGGIRYQVPGLEDSVEIRDYRAVGRAALEAASSEVGAQRFHQNFDSPALVTIHRNGQSTVVELREPTDGLAEVYDMLWIGAQVNQSLPAWPTVWHIQSPEQDERQSFVAILE
jgi:hypothetical protein